MTKLTIPKIRWGKRGRPPAAKALLAKQIAVMSSYIDARLKQQEQRKKQNSKEAVSESTNT